jgi:hypothetical protein
MTLHEMIPFLEKFNQNDQRRNTIKMNKNFLCFATVFLGKGKTALAGGACFSPAKTLTFAAVFAILDNIIKIGQPQNLAKRVMTENATIFIPDISGYTDFMSTTELEHSSHIINELLDLLVQSNATACTLAEVEGDALLFYRKGEPIPLEVVAAMLQSDQAGEESFKAFCESHA